MSLCKIIGILIPMKFNSRLLNSINIYIENAYDNFLCVSIANHWIEPLIEKHLLKWKKKQMKWGKIEFCKRFFFEKSLWFEAAFSDGKLSICLSVFYKKISTETCKYLICLHFNTIRITFESTSQ